MKPTPMTAFFAAAAYVFAATSGCVNIHVHFPQKEIEEAAEKIVDEVRPEIGQAPDDPEGGDAVESPPPPGSGEALRGGPAARARRLERSSFLLPAALAAPGGLFQEDEEEEAEEEAQEDEDQEEEEEEEEAKEEEKERRRLRVDTPKIKAIKETLRKRYPKLFPFYEKGAVGEANDGTLVVRDTEGLDRREIRDLKVLVEAENKDRKNLYVEIARANSLKKSDAMKIGRLFAAEWKDKCRTGWWIQTGKGKWIRKPPPKKKEKGKEGGKGAD